MSAYLGVDCSHRELIREHARNLEDEPGESTNKGSNGLKASSTVERVLEDDGNDSIASSETASQNAETSGPLHDLLPARPLGLSRRAGYTNYSDYDVVTVHGVRYDYRTACTSSIYNSNWIEDQLLSVFSVRQLDYTYDTSDSARFYDTSADGINIEANALLDSLAENRVGLPDTEYDRPIIWICHDLGGSIVKQALINAMDRQPSPACEGRPGFSTAARKMYRRLPLLTSTIIFLGCPHGVESGQVLEDELFALMCLPGPPLRTRTMPKISHLARQIERANVEFLETKVLGRAVIFNVTTGPEKHEAANAADETQTEQNPAPQTADPGETPSGLFSVYNGGVFHTFGVFDMVCLQSTDHLGLVMPPADDQEDPLAWDKPFDQLLDDKIGYSIKIDYAFLPYLHSLLSLAPPTRVTEYRISADGLGRSDVASWIIEHDVFDRKIDKREGPETVYLHGGLEHQVIDMRSVSRQLYASYDLVKVSQNHRGPCAGCFYFEFDQLDSRRRGIRAMIISFLCAYACRFWNDGDEQNESSVTYLRRFKCWSVNDLIILFLRVQKCNAMRGMIIILGQIDQCDDEERIIFLQAIQKRRNWSDLYCSLLITTTRPDGLICDILAEDSVISLDECPLSLDEYLAYPSQPGATEDRMQRLLVRRPELAHIRPQLAQVFEKFRNVPSLQDTVLEWLAGHRPGASTGEAADIVRELWSDPHQSILHSIIDRLSAEEQDIVAKIHRWIKYAAEPLTLEILAEAIRHSMPQEKAQPRHIRSPEDFGRFVKRTMAGIISMDGRDVRFSDDAFYEVSETGGSGGGRQDQARRSHADMATVCLRYLLRGEGQAMLRSQSVDSHGMDGGNLVVWSPIMLPRHHLVSYALRFWTVHYQAAGEYRPSSLATELLEDRCKRAAWAEAVYVTSNPFTRIQKEYMSPLPYMAMFGLDDLVRRQIEGDAGAQAGRSQDQWLAIVEAARNGHEKTVALLLEQADTDAAGLGEALHWASNFGEGGALDCLVSKALGLEGFRWPPFILDRAVAAGLESLVSALVGAGYDLNEENSNGKGRAIHTAIEHGQDRVLKILLDSGRVDLTLENDHGQSPLVLAAEMGNPESVRHLLAAVGNSEARVVDLLLLNAVTFAHHEALGVLIDAHIHAKSNIVDKVDDEFGAVRIPLIEAASNGFHGCTRVLLERGADPSASNEYGSALYQAVNTGQYFGICRILLEKGASPDESATEATLIPLMRAIELGVKSLVGLLLDHGAKINFTDPNPYECYDTPLALAASCGNVDIISLLLERGADPNPVCEEKESSKSPLYAAASDQTPKVCEILIKHGAEIQWTARECGSSVLHAAHDSPDLLSVLLQNGADINAADNDNWTTLMRAAQRNQVKSVEYLLGNAIAKPDLEVMSTNQPTSTALHMAIEYGNSEIVKLLVQAGADINRQRDDGKFPLGMAIEYRYLSSVERDDMVTLMLHRKPDLGLSDNDRNTVLHNISNETPLSVVMRLVEEGAPVQVSDQRGYTPLAQALDCSCNDVARYLTTVKGVKSDMYHPWFGSLLHMAAAKSTMEVVRQLVRTGADHSVVDPAFGEPVLYSAIGHIDMQECLKITRYLVEELGVDVNVPGGKYGSALLRITATMLEDRASRSVLKYLLRHGARTDQADSSGRTALHWVVMRQDIGALKILLKFGADVSAADNYGRTALHFAASKKDTELLLCILKSESCPDVDVADVDGWTPLMWACRSGAGAKALLPILVNSYNADVCVRSRDMEWSPLKLARVSGLEDESAECLVPGVDSKGYDESRVSQDREATPGINFEWYCNGCEAHYLGQKWDCSSCVFSLCFKCIRHSATMHDPAHTFVRLGGTREGSDADANESEDGGESQSGGESEEQYEDDGESEEEDDDEDSE